VAVYFDLHIQHFLGEERQQPEEFNIPYRARTLLEDLEGIDEKTR
jgi:hypothetical protein